MWRVWVVMAMMVGGAVGVHVNFHDDQSQQEITGPFLSQHDQQQQKATEDRQRDERVFIVLAEISPDKCSTSNTTNTLGTCMTANECSQRGGTGSGTCANGLGVCCLITRTCNTATSLNNTYFVNPGSGSSELGACTVTMNRMNKNICQVRLNFLGLELSQPDTDGNCKDDFITVTGGVSTAPMLCGLLTGQHIYYELDPNGGAVKLTVDRATTASLTRTWSIQIAQIPCDSKYRAPVGCLQYYTETTNTINSFNFLNTDTYIAGTRQLANLDYGVCIRRADNYCGITWEANYANGRFGFSVSDHGDVVDPNLIGTSDTSSTGERCTTDYVVIPSGTFRNEQDNNAPMQADRYCGLGFPEIVTSTSQPFTLYVTTDSNETSDEGNRGFSLTYRQTTTCT